MGWRLGLCARRRAIARLPASAAKLCAEAASFHFLEEEDIKVLEAFGALRNIRIEDIKSSGARYDAAWARLHCAPEGISGEAKNQSTLALARCQKTLGALDCSELHGRLLGEGPTLDLSARPAEMVNLATSMSNVIWGADNVISCARRAIRGGGVGRAKDWLSGWLDNSLSSELSR